MLKNKHVLITGASSGIGEACAIRFAKAGAKLLLCARRLPLLNELKLKLEQEFNAIVHTFELDISDAKNINKAWEQLPEEWQHIDILVNNAGLAAGLHSLQEAEIEDCEAMINTNIKGLLYITKKVIPIMIERNKGHIVNLGSIAGHQVYPKGAVYCATKFAVNALSQGLRMDLSGTAIRVTSIDPGAVETNFSHVRFKGDHQRAKSVYQGMQPLTAEDIADAIIYCTSCPPHVNISEMIIMPTAQASATLVARKDQA